MKFDFTAVADKAQRSPAASGAIWFLAGLFAQDFALFGAEGRGAPVIVHSFKHGVN